MADTPQGTSTLTPPNTSPVRYLDTLPDLGYLEIPAGETVVLKCAIPDNLSLIVAGGGNVIFTEDIGKNAYITVEEGNAQFAAAVQERATIVAAQGNLQFDSPVGSDVHIFQTREISTPETFAEVAKANGYGHLIAKDGSLTEAAVISAPEGIYCGDPSLAGAYTFHPITETARQQQITFNSTVGDHLALATAGSIESGEIAGNSIINLTGDLKSARIGGGANIRSGETTIDYLGSGSLLTGQDISLKATGATVTVSAAGSISVEESTGSWNRFTATGDIEVKGRIDGESHMVGATVSAGSTGDQVILEASGTIAVQEGVGAYNHLASRANVQIGGHTGHHSAVHAANATLDTVDSNCTIDAQGHVAMKGAGQECAVTSTTFFADGDVGEYSRLQVQAWLGITGHTGNHTSIEAGNTTLATVGSDVTLQIEGTLDTRSIGNKCTVTCGALDVDGTVGRKFTATVRDSATVTGDIGPYTSLKVGDTLEVGATVHGQSTVEAQRFATYALGDNCEVNVHTLQINWHAGRGSVLNVEDAANVYTLGDDSTLKARNLHSHVIYPGSKVKAAETATVDYIGTNVTLQAKQAAYVETVREGASVSAKEIYASCGIGDADTSRGDNIADIVVVDTSIHSKAHLNGDVLLQVPHSPTYVGQRREVREGEDTAYAQWTETQDGKTYAVTLDREMTPYDRAHDPQVGYVVVSDDRQLLGTDGNSVNKFPAYTLAPFDPTPDLPLDARIRDIITVEAPEVSPDAPLPRPTINPEEYQAPGFFGRIGNAIGNVANTIRAGIGDDPEQLSWWERFRLDRDANRQNAQLEAPERPSLRERFRQRREERRGRQERGEPTGLAATAENIRNAIGDGDGLSWLAEKRLVAEMTKSLIDAGQEVDVSHLSRVELTLLDGMLAIDRAKVFVTDAVEKVSPLLDKETWREYAYSTPPSRSDGVQQKADGFRAEGDYTTAALIEQGAAAQAQAREDARQEKTREWEEKNIDSMAENGHLHHGRHARPPEPIADRVDRLGNKIADILQQGPRSILQTFMSPPEGQGQQAGNPEQETATHAERHSRGGRHRAGGGRHSSEGGRDSVTSIIERLDAERQTAGNNSPSHTR